MSVYTVFRKRQCVYPTVHIEKGGKGQVEVLARMSALEAIHKKEIARLRTELEECQNKCKNLQQQLDVYQNMEKSQQSKSLDAQKWHLHAFLVSVILIHIGRIHIRIIQNLDLI